jgi:hypothetical protein
MGTLPSTNVLFQQGYHRADWLSRVEGRKEGGRGEISCLSDVELLNTRLLISFERAFRVGWPAKGVVFRGPFAGG